MCSLRGRHHRRADAKQREVLTKITSAKESHFAGATDVHYFERTLAKYSTDGSLPGLSNGREALLALVGAPITGVVFVSYLREARGHKLYRILGTSQRMNRFSKCLLVGLGASVYLAAGVLLEESNQSQAIRLFAGGIAVFSALSLLIVLVTLVYKLRRKRRGNATGETPCRV
jgi:hypothetical protein